MSKNINVICLFLVCTIKATFNSLSQESYSVGFAGFALKQIVL